jgi:hypothetical protein
MQYYNQLFFHDDSTVPTLRKIKKLVGKQLILWDHVVLVVWILH